VTKLWGGRFAGVLDPAFDSFNRSLAFDARLWRDDVRGSIAWAKAIEAAGILSAPERTKIVAALETIDAELERDPSSLATSSAEDIHSFVEQRLSDLTGDLAKKLHTGRSRNDQVATDLKLWTKGAIGEIEEDLRALIRALIELAEPNAAVPMPATRIFSARSRSPSAIIFSRSSRCSAATDRA